ncbi:hypothetical protein B0H13DRAFT_2346264 [Mycena leptocephala]|nr:hypothetical protein B0H13DRAFT_2346264 [Mycena leptocephala]
MRYTVDLGEVACQMAGLVEKNVVDPTLRAWATPAFTTTTANDTTVSAVLLMATLKKYFTYIIMLGGCGIQRVTLDGEQSDWVDILGRLERLKEYGLETATWYHLLRPVIDRFVAAFDDPASAANVDFWQRQGGQVAAASSGHDAAPETLNAAEFWAAHTRPDVNKDLVLPQIREGSV